MQSNIHYQQSIFKILIIIIVFGLSSLPNSIVEAAANNMIQLQLLDLDATPIPHMRLTAWRINTSHSQDSGHTGASGTVLLHLPPGQYYVTGDITTLKNRTAYAAGLKNNHTTTLYFISTIFTVSESTSTMALTIDNRCHGDGVVDMIMPLKQYLD